MAINQLFTNTYNCACLMGDRMAVQQMNNWKSTRCSVK
jgi:hypothetical protein